MKELGTPPPSPPPVKGCFTHNPTKLSQPGLISLTSCPHKFFFQIQEKREKHYHFSE